MDNITTEMKNFIHHEAHHAVDEALAGPQAVNRVIGEAMRHIGSNLTLTSSSYLPLRQDEIMVPPEPMVGQDTRALLLVRRSFHSKNSFQVLATVKVVNPQEPQAEHKLEYTIVYFQPNPDDLSATQFMTLPPELSNEVERQLRQLINREGKVLLQAVMAPNYFDVKQPVEEAIPGAKTEANLL